MKQLLAKIKQSTSTDKCALATEAHAQLEHALANLQPLLDSTSAQTLNLATFDHAIDEFEEVLQALEFLLLNLDSAEVTRLFLQMAKDFDTWKEICRHREIPLPKKPAVINAIKDLPPELLRGIIRMEKPCLILKLPEPMEKTVNNIDSNRFAGQKIIENWSGKNFTDAEFWGLLPTQLEFEITEGVANPAENADISGNIGEKMDKYATKFAADGLDVLGTSGYLALWRLFEQEKKADPNLPILDRNTATYLNRKHLTKAVFMPACHYWRSTVISLYSGNPASHRDNLRCRPSLVVFKAALRP